MTSRKRVRQQSALKTTLRLTLITAVAAITGLVIVLILLFNFMKEEEGRASQTMLFRSCNTIQDTTNVLRGSMNQLVIGVVVETSGNGNPVKLTSINFSANGTSQPVEQNIENARLWYTGNDPNFMPLQQTGNTLNIIPDKPFEISCNQTMQQGKNYFWLTFDIKPDAAYAPGYIDATCNEIRLGAITYKPYVSAPAGRKFIESNIPYFSMGNFPANNVNGWNSRRDGSGIAPKQINAARNSYFVQAGHHIIAATGANLQTVVVEKGGEFKITSPLRLVNLNVACGGTVQQDVKVNDYYCFTNLYMDNGANYIHNNDGYFPGLNCMLMPKSNQIFYQYGEETFPENISWGNVMIDAASAINIDVKNCFNDIKGDFELRRTGDDRDGKTFGLFSSVPDTIKIAGSFIINGGHFNGIKGKTPGTLVIRIGRNLNVKGGSINDDSGKGNLYCEIGGDVTLTGGDFNSGNSAASCLVFSGKGETKWYQKPTATVSLGNITVADGRTLNIRGDKLGDLLPKSVFDVQSGAKLVCNEFIVSGDGNFMLQDMASLSTGNKEGINSDGQKGSIQTKSRQFHSGANYIYTSACQPQQTGNFITRPIPNTIRKLIIEKESSSQKIVLTQNLSITEQALINKGELIENGNELKLPRITEAQ